MASTIRSSRASPATSRFRRRAASPGMFGVAEEVSDISLACRQIGPINIKGKFEQGDLVYRQSRSLFFKKMQVVRGCDAKRQRPRLSRLFRQADRGIAEKLHLDRPDHAVGRPGGAEMRGLRDGLEHYRSQVMTTPGAPVEATWVGPSISPVMSASVCWRKSMARDIAVRHAPGGGDGLAAGRRRTAGRSRRRIRRRSPRRRRRCSGRKQAWLR